jgi:hypothetical protein
VIGQAAVLPNLVSRRSELCIVEEMTGRLSKEAVKRRIVLERLIDGASGRHHGWDYGDDTRGALTPNASWAIPR